MTENLRKLIHILSDGEFHSGAELGQILDLTRSAIWKLIRQFSDWDIKVEARTNKGYRIAPLEFLNKQKLEAYLPHSTLEIFDSLPSTNNYLMQIAAKTQGTHVCFAEKQTAGKGRLGRHWISPYARNIYLSVLWHFGKDLSQLSGLSLAIALSIIDALKAYGIQQNIGLKWPNDVLYQQQKLAGVLIEASGETHSHSSTVVIGVGLNVDMPFSMTQYIDRPYIDIATLTSERPSRNKLAGLLLQHIFSNLTLFQTKGFSPFLPRWPAVDLAANQPVTLLTPTGNISGIGHGIDAQGHFTLTTQEGEIRHFASGEISLRLGE